MFLISMKSSVDTYKAMHKAVVRWHPDEIPSYDQIKQIVSDITGVDSVIHPMCKNSCFAIPIFRQLAVPPQISQWNAVQKTSARDWNYYTNHLFRVTFWSHLWNTRLFWLQHYAPCILQYRRSASSTVVWCVWLQQEWSYLKLAMGCSERGGMGNAWPRCHSCNSISSWLIKSPSLKYHQKDQQQIQGLEVAIVHTFMASAPHFSMDYFLIPIICTIADSYEECASYKWEASPFLSIKHPCIATPNLGEEVWQPSQPYANLSQQELLWCQVNALSAIISDLLGPPGSGLPWGATDVGQEFVLLQAQDWYQQPMQPCEADAFYTYLKAVHNFLPGSKGKWCPKIICWAWLWLSNGQVARLQWKEELKPVNKIRTLQNVKVSTPHLSCCHSTSSDMFDQFIWDHQMQFGEVLYYFCCQHGECIHTFAMVSVYSEPDPCLLMKSYSTFISCSYTEDKSLLVIQSSWILSVMVMVPHRLPGTHDNNCFFVLKRLVLDVADLDGANEWVSSPE